MKGRARGLLAWGLVLLCLGLVALSAWYIFGGLAGTNTTVTIAGTAVKAQVVSTDEDLMKGLGGVTKLDSGTGMLFVFPSDGPQEMWMKDMVIDLDIIWINDTKTVVYVERNVTPATYPETFRSPKPARYVLEVPAGTAASSGIRAGVTATFDLPARLKRSTISS